MVLFTREVFYILILIHILDPRFALKTHKPSLLSGWRKLRE